MYWFTTVKGSVEITVFDNPQKVKGQLSIVIVKQAVMFELQQLKLCTVEIQPCYLSEKIETWGITKAIASLYNYRLLTNTSSGLILKKMIS